MFSTRVLQACRITLFTRPGCGLCEQGKTSLSEVWDRRPFVYREENIDVAGSKWRDLYDFDVPVVRSLTSNFPCHMLTGGLDPHQ